MVKANRRYARAASLIYRAHQVPTSVRKGYFDGLMKNEMPPALSL